MEDSMIISPAEMQERLVKAEASIAFLKQMIASLVAGLPEARRGPMVERMEMLSFALRLARDKPMPMQVEGGIDGTHADIAEMLRLIGSPLFGGPSSPAASADLGPSLPTTQT
jgi:hypothetical protein